MARIEPLPENTVHYFGFPRYLLLACVRYLFLWLISPTAGKRFFYKLQLLSNWGSMREVRRLWQIAKVGGDSETLPLFIEF